MPRRKSRSARSRSPRQERSRQTVEAIRQAAFQILARDGVRGLTTRAIAERAGVGVSSLYQYFPNREAIVADLIRTYILPELDPRSVALANVTGDPDAQRRLGGMSLPERLRAVIDHTVRANRHLIARFGIEFQARYLEQVREYLGLPKSRSPSLGKLTEAHEHEMPLADPRLADVFIRASFEMLPLLVAYPET